MAEPQLPRTDAESDQVIEDVAAISQLAGAGVEVDGEVQVAESTYVIYGRSTYDGEVIVGEYNDAVEAAEVLRSVQHRGPTADQSGRVSD